VAAATESIRQVYETTSHVILLLHTNMELIEIRTSCMHTLTIAGRQKQTF